MFELFEIDNNVCSLIRWFCSIQVKSDVIGLHLIDQTLGPQMKRIYTKNRNEMATFMSMFVSFLSPNGNCKNSHFTESKESNIVIGGKNSFVSMRKGKMKRLAK